MEDKETLNLDKLESQLDNALAKETKESLTNWLDCKRNKETLEEVMNKDGYHESDYDKIWREGVNFGVKWQREQDKNKYSEGYIAEKLFNHPVMDRIRSSKSDAEARRIILQQLKKK
jgi:hypothetical protein